MAPTVVPENTVAPSVTGVGYLGYTLSCARGSWSHSPTSYAYQWQRDGVNIAGATASTYELVAADTGADIRCVVTASNGAGASLPAASNEIGPVINAFVIVVKTDNTGPSNNDQFEFTGAVGTNYTVYYEDEADPSVNGTFTDLNAAETLTFPEGAGTYRLWVSGNFTRLRFFDGGDKLKLLDVERWGSIVWTDLAETFRGCANMTVTATDVPNLSICPSLNGAFFDATLANPDVSAWDVGNVNSMWNVFRGTQANPDVSAWDFGDVTVSNGMFWDASVAQPNVSAWNVSKNASMMNKFRDAPLANPDMSSWTLRSAGVNMSNFAIGATSLSVANYSAALNRFLANIVANGGPLNVTFNVAATVQYNAGAAAARTTLTTTHGWIISDGGQEA